LGDPCSRWPPREASADAAAAQNDVETGLAQMAEKLRKGGGKIDVEAKGSH